MPRGRKRSIDETNADYDSDGGFIEQDEDERPKKKTTKPVKSAKPSASKKKDEEEFWELTKPGAKAPKRVTISDFKGNKYVGIREFYEKDDEYLPGKKGISLNIDQYKELIRHIPAINAAIREQGFEIDDVVDAGEKGEKGESSAKDVKSSKAKKSNIDTTSDEDEE